MRLSPNLRKWLLIGGGSIVGLLLVCLIAYVVMGRGVFRSGTMQNTQYFAEDGSVAPSAGEKAALPGIVAQSAPQAPPAVSGGVGGGPADSNGFVTDNLAAAPTAMAAPVSDQEQQNQQHLIVKNGTVNVSVENTYSAEKSIEGMINQMSGDGAFVVSTNESPTGYGTAPYITMVIRIPAKNFDGTMDALAKLAAKGTTPTLTKTADDVTSQYVDVSARLEALEAARDRLKQIMSESQNTNDLLLAEQQLTQREAEIDALKGQKQFLEQSAALSSITVTLTPYVLSQPVDSSWRPLETVREAFDRLVGSLRDFGDFVITFVIAVLPWLLVLALIVFGVYRFIRSRVMRARARNAASAADES